MIRVAVIGMGFGAAVHVPALARTPEVTISALADAGSGRAAALIAEAGLAARAYDDGARLLDAAVADAVVIAVPPARQAALCLKAIETGTPFVCEKPLALDAATAGRIVEAARQRDLTAAVGFEIAYEPGLRALIAAAREGAVGTLHHIAVTWTIGGAARPGRVWSWKDDAALGGGIVREYCSHAFDYLARIAGSPIAEIAGQLEQRIRSRPDGRGGESATSGGDWAHLWCRLANGVTAGLLVSNVEPGGFGHRIEIYGADGRLALEHPAPFAPDGARLHRHGAGGALEPIAIPMADGAEPSDNRIPPVAALLDDFFAALDGHRPPALPSLDDALAAHRAGEAARRSAAAGGSPRAVH